MPKINNDNSAADSAMLRSAISRLIDYIRSYKKSNRAETASKLDLLKAKLGSRYKNRKQADQLADEDLHDLWSSVTRHIDDQNREMQLKDQQIKNQELLILARDQQISNQEMEIQSKVQEIQARDEQIARLQSKLNEINNSITWRMAGKLHRAINSVFPPGTKRRFLTKRILFNLAHPGLLLKNLNPRSLATYFHYLNTIGARRMENVVSPQIPTVPAVAAARRKIEVPDPETIASLDDIAGLEFEDLKNPLVSIIIPVYNQWKYTYTCLQSVFANTDEVEYEVIVADDNSNDLTSAMLQKVRNIKVVSSQENQGFIRNCNNAALHASGKYLLFLNNDTYVTKGWLKSLVSPLENDASVGIAGGKLLYKDGSLQEAGCIIWNSPADDNLVTNFGRGQDPDSYEFNFLREVDYCSGCCLMVRENIFRSNNGFNSHYLPAYSEDTDLAFTARELGYKTVYQPECEIVHYEGISHGWDWDSPSRRRMKINKNIFYKKWESVIKRDHFAPQKDIFLARDRSRYRKHLLFIEYQVPTWDHDAGSLTIYSYLKLLAKLGFRITFIPYNLAKLMPYTLELQRLGIEVVYGNFNFDNWIQANGKYIDVALLARPEIALSYIDKIRQFSKAPILYYVHDLHYLREKRRYEIEKDEKILEVSEELREMEFAIFSKSDVIMTPSAVEADILVKEFPAKRVEVIPAYIYEDDFPGAGGTAFDKRRDLIYLGGFLHKPNIDAVLWFAGEVFPLILTKLPDIRLIVIGHSPTDSVRALAGDNIVITGFVEDLEPWFNSARLFVAPLRYGAGLKGKIVTSMYYGLPVVTTTVGNEGLDLTDGEQAMVANDPVEFADKVIRLYTDEILWQSMSHSGVQLVRERFSGKAAGDKFLSIVNLHLCSKCNKLFTLHDRSNERNNGQPVLCSSCRSDR